VNSLSDTPRLQYYDVQTLEYRYISKLPMKKEQIWKFVQPQDSRNIANVGVKNSQSINQSYIEPILTCNIDMI
jgi:hypothetical protein